MTTIPERFQASEQEVRDLFAPLGVLKVELLYGNQLSWMLTVSSNYRAIGKFCHQQKLLHRVGGIGRPRGPSTFCFDNPPWGTLPVSWLPKADL